MSKIGWSNFVVWQCSIRQRNFRMFSGKPSEGTVANLSEIKSNKYEEGVTCPNCFSLLSDDQKKRFRMRQQQIQIQKKLGKNYFYQREFK